MRGDKMETNGMIKQEKNEVTIQNNKEIASDIMLEEIISKAILPLEAVLTV